MKKATTMTAAAHTRSLQEAKLQKKSMFVGFGVEKNNAAIILAMATAKPRYRKPDAVKRLEQMVDADNQRRHPNTPSKYLANSKYRDDTANGLTKCIVDWIKLNGGQAERINTTGIPVDKRKQVIDILGRTQTIGSIEWRKSVSTVGSADISATIKGRSVKIEVKIGKDRQSEDQKRYQHDVECAGGLYFIAKDFTSFYEWYKLTFC